MHTPSIDAYLDSFSAPHGAPSLELRAPSAAALRQLAAALSERPLRAAAIERLDLSSDSASELGAEGVSELLTCLDVLPRLEALKIEGGPSLPMTRNASRGFDRRGGGGAFGGFGGRREL
jgi:hypothetical protein